MMTEADSDKKDQRDPVIEDFVELRKYIEHSHDGPSKRLGTVDVRLEKVEVRLETVETRLGTVETRLGAVETGQQRLELKLDSGFDRLGRKIDALMSGRRASERPRKP